MKQDSFSRGQTSFKNIIKEYLGIVNEYYRQAQGQQNKGQTTTLRDGRHLISLFRSAQYDGHKSDHRSTERNPETEKKKAKDNDTKVYKYYGCRIRIDGEQYLVRSVIRVAKDGRYYYDGDITSESIIKEASQGDAPATNAGSTPKGFSKNSITEWIVKVKEKLASTASNQNPGFYQFAGENAVTADKLNLSEARKSESERKLAEDKQKWIEQVNKFEEMSDKEQRYWTRKNLRTLIDFSEVPEVLQILGVKSGKLKVEGGFFSHSTRQKKHPGMNFSVLKKLPEAITDPLIVMKGTHEDSYLVVVELTDKNGATIVTPVLINHLQKGTAGIVANFVGSAYGKTVRGDNTVPDNGWFFKDWNLKNILYINKEKSTKWFSGTDSARVVDPKLIDALSNFIISDAMKNVKTEEDLAALKARLGMQSFYQSAWHGSPYVFDEFDLGAIGTGEGAQAHGWGLYFAQNREVSERYKERLESREHVEIKTITIDGREYTARRGVWEDSAGQYDGHKSDHRSTSPGIWLNEPSSS